MGEYQGALSKKPPQKVLWRLLGRNEIGGLRPRLCSDISPQKITRTETNFREPKRTQVSGFNDDHVFLLNHEVVSMKSRYAKVSEIAERFRVSVDAVYLWIRQGKIPADCVVRIAGTVRVDEEQFEHRLRSGALYQSRGRKPIREPKASAGLVAEDNFTTVKEGMRTSHRWTTGSGCVDAD